MRLLIAGVGYLFLRDLSVGPGVLPHLQDLPWPPQVEVEIDNLSFGPIAVVQRLEERPGHYDRMIFITGVERGNSPGTVHRYAWSHELPPPEEIQARVAEAVTGVISLDNLLIITEHFGVLPNDVVVIEVEPEDTGWGDGFTPAVSRAFPEIIETVWREATRDVMTVPYG